MTEIKIKRWDFDAVYISPDGDYVLFEDHIERIVARDDKIATLTEQIKDLRRELEDARHAAQEAGKL